MDFEDTSGERLPKILVVDDQRGNLHLLRRLLARIDAGVKVAQTGSEALALTRQHEFALILLDVDMPGMDGYEVARILKSDERTRDIPIIFVTGTCMDENHRLKGYDSGAIDFIERFVDDQVLISKAEAFLELYRQRCRLKERHRLAETALEMSEQTVEGLLEASPAALIAFDRQARVMWWNTAAETIFGHCAEEVLGQPLPAVLETEEDTFGKLFERARSGQSLHNVPAIRRNRNGRQVAMEVSSASLRDSRGEVSAIIFAVNDVTERVQFERQFLQAQKMEAVGQLTGGIAHDFNNLLGVLIGNLDLIRERVENDPDTLSLVDMALNAGLRGADLNERLLAFSRRQTLQPESVDINGTLAEMIRLLARSLGERVEIRLHCADAIWPVRIDPVQLETTIVNLSLNARDAMPNGGVLTIETGNASLDDGYCRTHEELRPGDYVMISVSDTGTGMTPEVLARAFDPFFTTKDVGKGTGMGLSMVYGFLKQSGGHVNIYSEVGRGTTLRLYLPRYAGDGTAIPESARAEVARAAGGELILVVEDNPDMRLVTVKQLRDLGYRCEEAENAEQALALLETGPAPDLLFSDVVMPGQKDGIDLACDVAAMYPSTAILLASGFTERTTLRTVERQGRPIAFAMLDKPFRKIDLARAVASALDRKRTSGDVP